MPLDPAVEGILTFMAQQGRPSYAEMTIEQVRGGAEMMRALQKPPREVARCEDAAYGPDPRQAVRVYVPEGTPPFPVILHFHGGGFVTGSLEAIDEPSRALANDVGAVVVSATYRLAPEATFPAAHDDALTALTWVAEHAVEYGGDPARLALLGDSAGGNLAASAAVRARDAGSPPVRALALLYPLVSPDAETASREEFKEGYLIDAASVEYFQEMYAGPEPAAGDPRQDLFAVPSLAGLPPTLVVTNEYDMLRDEGEEFASRLQQAGVEVTAHRFDGLVHIVYWMSGAVPAQADMHAAVVAFLREQLL